MPRLCSVFLFVSLFLFFLSFVAPVNFSTSFFVSSLWPSFYNEFLVFAGLLCFLLVLVLFNHHSICFPSSSLFFLFLVFIPPVQWLFGVEYFRGDLFLVVAFLLLFFLAILCGFSSAAAYTTPLSLQYFSWFFVILGLFSFYMALHQFLRLDSLKDWVFYNYGDVRIFGNIRQPNHFATVMLLSLLGSWYLFERKNISKIVFCLLLPCFLTVVAMSQSRTALISLLCVFLFYICFRRLTFRFSMLGFISIFLAYLLINFSLQELETFLFAGQAFMENKNVYSFYDGARYIVWRDSIAAILQSPLLGYGWNQTGLIHTATDINFEHSFVFLHSHNLFLDILLWNGWLIGGVLISFLLFFIYKCFLHIHSKEDWFSMALIGVVFVHAMFEYPLYYAYFLCPVGFLLGVYLYGKAGVRAFKIKGEIVCLIVLVGGFLSGKVMTEYRIADPGDRLIRTEYKNIENIVLLTQLRELRLQSSQAIVPDMTREKMDLLRQLVFRYPNYRLLISYAEACELNGCPEESRRIRSLADRLFAHKLRANKELMLQPY